MAQVNVDPGSGDSGGSGVNALAAVAIVAACFFVGLLIAVVTERPLW